jgi:hypothetical protein
MDAGKKGVWDESVKPTIIRHLYQLGDLLTGGLTIHSPYGEKIAVDTYGGYSR